MAITNPLTLPLTPMIITLKDGRRFRADLLHIDREEKVLRFEVEEGSFESVSFDEFVKAAPRPRLPYLYEDPA